MKCPRDGTVLQPVRLPGLVLDKCHLCDGVWLDDGELKKLLALKLTQVEEMLEQKYGDPQVELGSPDGYMVCPRCAGRLQTVTISYERGVRVDRCESCLGLWLDDKELDAVLGSKREKPMDSDAGVNALSRFIKSFWKSKS